MFAVLTTLVLAPGVYSRGEAQANPQTLLDMLLSYGHVEKDICGNLISIDEGSKIAFTGDGIAETAAVDPCFMAILLEPLFFGTSTKQVREKAYVSGIVDLESHTFELPAGQTKPGITLLNKRSVNEIKFDQPFSNSPIIFIFTLSTVDPKTDMEGVMVTRIENEGFTFSLEDEKSTPERIRWIAIETPTTFNGIKTWQSLFSCLKRMSREKEMNKQTEQLLGILVKLWESKGREKKLRLEEHITREE